MKSMKVKTASFLMLTLIVYLFDCGAGDKVLYILTCVALL